MKKSLSIFMFSVMLFMSLGSVSPLVAAEDLQQENRAEIVHFKQDDAAAVPSWKLGSDNDTTPMYCPVVIRTLYSEAEPGTLASDILAEAEANKRDMKRIFISGSEAGADKALAVFAANPDKFAGLILCNPKISNWPITAQTLAGFPVYIISQDNKETSDLCTSLNKFSSNYVSFVTMSVEEYENRLFDEAVLSWVLRTPDKYTSSSTVKYPGNDKGTVTVDGRELSYFVQLPKVTGMNFSDELILKDSSEKWPLVMDLHGSGGHEAVDSMIAGNLPGYGFDHIRMDSDCGYFRVYPRIPGGKGPWSSYGDLVIKVIETLKEKYSIDEDRIYLTGFSMGGMGTWDVAMQYPDYFAAIAPIAGSARDFENAHTIRHIPTLIQHGIMDSTVRYVGALTMYYRLKMLGANVSLNTESVDHKLTTEFRGEGTVAWLLRHRKSQQKNIEVIPAVDKPAAPKVKKIKDNSDTVSGTALPFSQVNVKIGDSVLSEVSDVNGEFFVTMDPIPKAGTKVTVTTVGLYGNEGEAAVLKVLDKTPPKKPKVSTVKAGSKVVKGKAEAKSTVYAVKKAKVIGKAKATKSGAFKIRLKKSLKKKAVIQVYAVDKAKNSGAKRKVVAK